ncbi:M20 family metallopeptidase [Microbacterium sp. CFBP9034]|uniref:M20 family metallopeptidase n=1 Tax=Microbacterium sp. CFBP9034 TaxID=3096540 RepID=UPI002A6A95CF|nr:M20 family metallopeptidase [Microbacterium sp. CFBP9034]MDY0908525.1 M20 family metallopeptidase [Microbacterium sp. CFBP9034]
MRLVERLEQLVSIETPTGHGAGIARAYDLVDGWLAPSLGEGRKELVDGVEHVRWGAERPRVLLLGHIDTVWPIGTIERLPFAVTGDRCTGPGVFDMKGGIVAAAEAVALAAHGGDIGVLLTGDEEVGSLTSRALLERVAAESGAVLVLEPSLAGAVKIARRGGGIYSLAVTGRAAHAGLEPWNGVNALVELAHQVTALPSLGDGRATTVSPTVAQAGTVTNAIPDRAAVRIDVRAWTLAELERVDGELRARRPVDSRAAIEVTGGINRPPMEKAASRELFALAAEVSRAIGDAELRAEAVGGASDGNFTAALGIPTLDGLGPDGDGAHAEHEWASLKSIAQRARLVAGMIDRWGR